MKRRKNAILLVIVVLMAACLTACSGGSSAIKEGEFVIATEEEMMAVETELTQEETSETFTEKTSVVETDASQEETSETSTEEISLVETSNSSILQIQSLEEGITLDKSPKLPYEVKMHRKSINALNNPIVIKEQTESGSKISFSFISEDEKIYNLSYGLMIQTNKKIEVSTIKTVGDIQTFSVNIPTVEESSTIVYEIKMYDDSLYYIAIQIDPQ